MRPDKDCYVAVLGHYIDGNTVLLFPNEYKTSNFITANSSIDIPGDNDQKFELYIREPFGTDIVQVVACTDGPTLQVFLEEVLKGKHLIPDTPLVAVAQIEVKRGLDRVKRAIGLRETNPDHKKSTDLVDCA